MTPLFALLISLATGAPVDSELCRGVENTIESDMRVLESDLTKAAALEAAQDLSALVKSGGVGGEAEFRALNQSKIIIGHLLLRQAQEDRLAFGQDSAEFRRSASALCDWLGTEGFWYD